MRSLRWRRSTRSWAGWIDERLREEEMAQVTLIDLHLGPRPDEPGPPISRGPQAYSAEVTARLASDAAQIMARYPESRSALLPLLHLVQSEDGDLTPAGLSFCAGQ